MKVTEITDGKRKDMKNVFVDGEYSFNTHYYILAKNNIKEGMTITAEVIEKIKEEEQYRYGKEHAVNMLARKDYTVFEMKKKLKEKGVEAKVTEKIIEQFISDGYLNDERFCENYAQYLFEVKKYGRYRIKNTLLEKGIDKDIINLVLEKYNDEEKNDEKIKEIMSKYKNADLKDQKQVKKIYDALMRKGYSYSDIKRHLNQIEVEYE